MAGYKMYYDMFMELPMVQELLKENEKLRKKNKKLKYKTKALETILYDVCKPTEQKVHLKKLRSNVTIPLVKIKQEKLDEPTLCDTLVDNDDHDSVILINKETENIVYDLEEDDENDDDLNNGFDENNEEAQDIITDLKNELKQEVEEEAEEAEAEAEEAEEEEAEAEEAEEEEAEEEEAEEEEAEEEEAEEEEAEEEEAEEEEEVEEVTIKGKSYYTSNKVNGIIYEITKDEDVGDEVGIFKECKAIFHKK
jgi:uncharacterized membrane protein YqiK